MRTRAVTLALAVMLAFASPVVASDAPVTASPPCHDCYRAAAPIGSMSELVAYDPDDTRAIDQLLRDADALGLTVRDVSVTYVP